MRKSIYNRKRQELISSLKVFSQCPVVWDTKELTDFCEEMEKQWFKIGECYQVNFEAQWLEKDAIVWQAIDTFPDENLEFDLLNIKTWITQAREQYLTKTRRFYELEVASSSKYPKHYPPKAWDNNRIIQESAKQKISYFFKSIDHIVLQETLIFYLCHLVSNATTDNKDKLLWEKICTSDNIRVAINMIDPIGATNGVKTEYLCFEIDTSTPLAHAYPISKTEAIEINDDCKLIAIDYLQGFEELDSKQEIPKQWRFLGIKLLNL